MGNLHKFIEDQHGIEALHLLWEWKSWTLRIMIIGTIEGLHLDASVQI